MALHKPSLHAIKLLVHVAVMVAVVVWWFAERDTVFGTLDNRLILDGVFFLMVFAGIVFDVRPHYIIWSRLRRGLCIRCGYNLTGNTTGVCPECGTLRDLAPPA